MTFLFVVPSLRKNDAVGNDLLFQASVLREQGIEIAIYADTADQSASQNLVNKEQALKILRDPKTQLVYHHCFLWEKAEFFISQAARKAIIRFHNSTPPQFFQPYNYTLAQTARRAQLQTETLMQHENVSGIWAASKFNEKDALAAGAKAENISVIAPYTNLSEFESTSIEQGTADKIPHNKVNVLFVGRLVPNKNHIGLLKVLAAYKQQFGNEIVLHIVGKRDPSLGLYVDHMRHLIKVNELENNVIFWENASFSALHTLYSKCSLFLCMSQHEGFGVPVLEAQAHKLPVIVLERCALTPDDVLGEGQVSFAEESPFLIARAVHEISKSSILRKELTDQGLQNAKRFSPQLLQTQLKTLAALT
jgi:glycosyltransferase involved in cell wall biosynthesis